MRNIVRMRLKEIKCNIFDNRKPNMDDDDDKITYVLYTR